MSKCYKPLSGKYIDASSIVVNSTPITDVLDTINTTLTKLKRVDAIQIIYPRCYLSFTPWNTTNFTEGNVDRIAGDKLSFSDGKVYIGEGVSWIRVSGYSSLATYGGNISELFLLCQLYRGGTLHEHFGNDESVGDGVSYKGVQLGPHIIFVQAGDYLTLGYSGSLSGSYYTLAGSFLVEVIEY